MSTHVSVTAKAQSQVLNISLIVSKALFLIRVWWCRISSERQPRATRCRLLVLVMRVRTVALLSGEQDTACHWSRAADECAGRRRERISRGTRTSETDSDGRFVVLQIVRCEFRWIESYDNVEMPCWLVPYVIDYIFQYFYQTLNWYILKLYDVLWHKQLKKI